MYIYVGRQAVYGTLRPFTRVPWLANNLARLIFVPRLRGQVNAARMLLAEGGACARVDIRISWLLEPA